MLSKLYVRAALRGTGVGADLLAVAQKRSEELEAASIWLTVNRNNLRTIEWYRRKGFVNVQSSRSRSSGVSLSAISSCVASGLV